MRILLNDKEVIVPSSLSEFTIGQRIAFHNEHGRLLDEMLKSIISMEDGPEKELEITQFNFEKMFRTFAFFAGTTAEAIKASKFIDDVANIYYSSLAVLFEEEETMEPQREFVFKGEQWELAPPELSNSSKMKFGEFIDAKQLIKDMVGLGMGKWEYMLPICVIYLRKKGEAYKEEFLFEGSERLKLMEELPMDIAMQVGFFLSSIINFSTNTLRSSGNQESKAAADIQRNILSSMAGSTF